MTPPIDPLAAYLCKSAWALQWGSIVVCAGCMTLAAVLFSATDAGLARGVAWAAWGAGVYVLIVGSLESGRLRRRARKIQFNRNKLNPNKKP